ncbi:cGMP-dependent protein kinase, isozyme 2 forms cD5/T2 [Eufriesea mexicana]|nr:cGMP-dependent protein kinase, isozyme 2 forms cD5/T2 [Eufriesea mexicana]
MKVRSYPGRAVLEDPELLLDPDATRGRAMELLYEASWRECGVNWASNARSKPPSREDEYRQPYAEVISQLEGVLEGSRSSAREDSESRRSSSTGTTDSESSELNQTGNSQGGFLIPRPRLIVPVHTYARRRRTGAPPPARRRQIREGIFMKPLKILSKTNQHNRDSIPKRKFTGAKDKGETNMVASGAPVERKSSIGNLLVKEERSVETCGRLNSGRFGFKVASLLDWTAVLRDSPWLKSFYTAIRSRHFTRGKSKPPLLTIDPNYFHATR